MRVWWDKLITKPLHLDQHKIENMLEWCLKERILKVWQILAQQSDPSRKPTVEDMIKVGDS